MDFKNPIPVAVAIVEFEDQLVGIRRGIHPKLGEVAFPGGYINSGETFKQALSREFFEETGIKTEENLWEVFYIGDSLQSNRILIFGKYLNKLNMIKSDFKSNETQEIVLIDKYTKLAFPLHEEARDLFFNRN